MHAYCSRQEVARHALDVVHAEVLINTGQLLRCKNDLLVIIRFRRCKNDLSFVEHEKAHIIC